MTVALVNQDREKNSEKRSPGLKSEKEALLIGKITPKNNFENKISSNRFLFCIYVYTDPCAHTSKKEKKKKTTQTFFTCVQNGF